MSYCSIPTEPEHIYSPKQASGVFFPNSDNSASTPPPAGTQLCRSSKIRRVSGEVKRKSLISKYVKLNTVIPENEIPQSQHVKINLPFPSQLSEDFKNGQTSFPTNSGKTIDEIWKLPWIEEDENRFSKKFWLVFVVISLALFGCLIIGFGAYAYFTYTD